MADQTTSKTPVSQKMAPKVNWSEMEPCLGVYANQLMAQYDGQSLHLVFAQVNPPFTVGKTEEEVKEWLASLSLLKAIPVARLVIPLNSVRDMLRVLQEQLNKIDKIAKP
jgi:hypothetical protein